MKKILLPTDFSDNAYNAIEYAVQLFSDEQCTFFLLNTYTPVIFDNEYVIYNANVPSIDDVHKKDSLLKLKNIIEKIKKYYPNKNHIFKRIASFNLLINEIKQQVSKKGIELVIMGTQGATGAKQILFGSHTVHTIKAASCPVLAIPSSSYYEQPKNILFPTDFGIPLSDRELKIFKEIAVRYKSKVHVFHVLREEKLTGDQENIKRNLAKELKAIHHKFHFINEDEISHAIYKFQEQNSIDILIMINNKHSFFENLLFEPLVNKIGFHTKIPFLVIPHLR